MDTSLRYESTSRFITEISMSLGISVLINVSYRNLENTFDILSLVLAVSLLLIFIWLNMYFFIFPLMNYDKIKVYPDYLERHCFLFLDFKLTNVKWLQYYGYFITRRILIACVIVWLKDIVRVQIVWLALLCFWISKYQIHYKPFKSQINNFLNWANEVFLFIFSLLLFFFLNPNEAKKMELLGFIWIGFLIIFFVLNWGIIFPLKIFDICRYIKHKWKKKTREEYLRERREMIENAIRKRSTQRRTDRVVDLRKSQIIPKTNQGEIRITKHAPRRKES